MKFECILLIFVAVACAAFPVVDPFGTIYSVGQDGKFWKYNNGQWSNHVNLQSTIRTAASNGESIFAVGARSGTDVIFRITNGASYQASTPPSANNGTFGDICFYNATLGFAVAQYTPTELIVATTENGGNDWYYILAFISGTPTFPFFRINCNPNNYGFYLYGFDSNPAVIYTYSYSYLNPALQYITSSPLKAYDSPSWGFSPSGAYLAMGNMLYSSRNLLNFGIQATFPSVKEIKGITFYSATGGVILASTTTSNSDTLLFTQDGGTSWTQSPFLMPYMEQIFFVNGQAGIATYQCNGYLCITQTTNSGRSWQQMSVSGYMYPYWTQVFFNPPKFE